MAHYKSRVLAAGLTFAALGYCIFLAAPLLVFSQNDAEFNAGFAGVIMHLVPALAGAVIALTLIAALIPARGFRLLIALLVTVLFLFYVQSGFLVWGYGPFYGEPVKWEKFSTAGLVDTSVWVLGLVLGLLGRNIIVRNYQAILLFCVLAFTFSACVEAFREKPRFRSEVKESRSDSIFQFSREKNVLIIILDTFSTPAFEVVSQGSPEIRKDFADFTFFRNTLASFTTTAASVPSILTGIEYDNQIPYKKFLTEVLAEKSLPSVFLSRGYQSDVMSMTQLCARIKGACHSLNRVVARDIGSVERRELLELLDVTLFRVLPQPLKKRVYNNEKWLVQRIFAAGGSPRSLFNSVGFWDVFERQADAAAEKPTFKFLHFMLPHPPCRFDSRCNVKPPGKGKPRKEDYEEQAACSIQLMRRMISTLKRVGAYENTFVIVAADHGYAQRYIPFKNDRGLPAPEQAMPLLLMKPFGKSSVAEMTVSNAPAMLKDIPRTVAEAAGIMDVFPNESLLSLSEGMPRKRHYRSYGWNDAAWGRTYLPKMAEYAISGDVRDPASWNRSGTFAPP